MLRIGDASCSRAGVAEALDAGVAKERVSCFPKLDAVEISSQSLCVAKRGRDSTAGSASALAGVSTAALGRGRGVEDCQATRAAPRLWVPRSW